MERIFELRDTIKEQLEKIGITSVSVDFDEGQIDTVFNVFIRGKISEFKEV